MMQDENRNINWTLRKTPGNQGDIFTMMQVCEMFNVEIRIIHLGTGMDDHAETEKVPKDIQCRKWFGRESAVNEIEGAHQILCWYEPIFRINLGLITIPGVDGGEDCSHYVLISEERHIENKIKANVWKKQKKGGYQEYKDTCQAVLDHHVKAQDSVEDNSVPYDNPALRERLNSKRKRTNDCMMSTRR